MPLSFLDLGTHPTDVQQAAAGAIQQQVAGNLAVTPAVDVRGPIREALRRRGVNQGLGLERRRVALSRKTADFERGQLPFEVGLGALSGALGVFGGVRAQQAATRQEAMAQESLGLQHETMAQQAEATRQQVEQSGRIRRALEGQGYPPSSFAPGP